jgi:hypothetical protein
MSVKGTNQIIRKEWGKHKEKEEGIRNSEVHLVDALDASDVLVHLQLLPRVRSQLDILETLVRRWGGGTGEHGSRFQCAAEYPDRAKD